MNIIKDYDSTYLWLIQTDIIRSCNTLDDISSTICVSNNTEDINLNAFNMIIEMNESKTLINHDICNCEFVNLIIENLM